jgi:hypothetical protein
MKADLKKLSTRMNKKEVVKMKPIDLNSLTKKEKAALKIIYDHAGKRYVYEAYSQISPEMAKKYLAFVSENPNAIYIKWDEGRKRFVA